jgi:hypothetical protein
VELVPKICFSYTLYKYSSDERDIAETALCDDDDDEVDVMECDKKCVIGHDIRNKMNFGCRIIPRAQVRAMPRNICVVV